MNREQRFDRREDQARDRDVTRTELANMDRFMDSHPEIPEQLKKDPSLVNDKKFENYLQGYHHLRDQHPCPPRRSTEHPNAFMNREQRFDRREDQARDRDVTRSKVADLDPLMANPPKAAEPFKKNPSLVNDKKIEKEHPALQQFLAEHPGGRQEDKQNTK